MIFLKEQKITGLPSGIYNKFTVGLERSTILHRIVCTDTHHHLAYQITAPRTRGSNNMESLEDYHNYDQSYY